MAVAKFAKSNLAKGKLGELLAVNYLKKKKYQILQTHFTFEHGELDIIAKDKLEIVFVEVKYRTQKKYGSPEESITQKKEEVLKRTAEGYLYKKKLIDIPCRFDVISIISEKNKVSIKHFINAF